MYSDPIADMLTRIRNALIAGHASVSVPGSKLKQSIAQILREEGFIDDFAVVTTEDSIQPTLRLSLKYVGVRREKRPVITGLERISKPGRRVYARRKDIPWVLSGMGVAILSTPRGVMTGTRARRLGVGGEVLCKIW
ncbi:MAG TPA: 30S ribosomal protein S8 [Anaerolineales bacterium]|uniref:Small ribosomal subunit protein uS8 n=1 Tax=uncultured Chloroflexi bacterium Rifle_16ft_4_minimus_6153 TaxID=1665079 RepID=A0A0H4TDD9_9CHLR|nr:30S ribosomal protein S8, small subunit ribosomal protein S8 [uncultured Chloroflexi bacterium Rifle_16ft_4_minimus_6153]HLE30602.1 30S ribosomal protein S8 [Anaerolineales bacterium]